MFAARVGFLLVLQCLLAFGCSDSSLAPPDDLFSVKDPPSNTPAPPAGCPSFDAAALPQDLAAPSKTPALGVTPGAFSVSSTGEARYDIPLVVPPGRASMQPDLVLSYDSGSTSDEGILGVGFDVRGLSSIGRCPKSIAQHAEIRGVRDDEKDPAEVGAATAPTDVSALGTSTGFSPPVPPTEAERPRPLDIAREAGIGAAGGAFELWWDATKDFVLFWATGWVYNGIKIWSAIYAGYKEGGTLGALNVLNPIYAILSPAAKSTQAAVDGDYRAAGREGVKALATLAITVVTMALGPKAPGSGGKNGPGGGANTGSGPAAQPSGQVSVPRNAHLAGKTHPATGVPFDKNGHPDFGKHITHDVKIKPTGSRLRDEKAANQAAGLPERPEGYTWHHHQDYGRMQLVPTDIHAATGHTGGFSNWKP